MARLLSRRCECGREYELFEHRGETLLQETGEPFAGCPGCGQPAERAVPLIGVPMGIDLGGYGSTGRVYPYFDRGLQRWIESAADRKRICKQMGVEPIDGDISDADLLGDRDREDRASAQRLAEYNDRVEHAPEFAAWRQHRDRIMADAKGRMRGQHG